jgi:tRNA (guanine-N7-)-methyltransferase
MQRPIKSFVLRAGRMSNRQQHALEHHLSQYSLSQHGEIWDLTQEFGRSAETIVEIGFGMGHSLAAMAKNQPELNFIGVEVHVAGVGSLTADLQDLALNNVRIANFDAVEVFRSRLADDCLQGIQIFFPDPWPKKRHQKRRLIQAEFIDLIIKKLKIGGFIHCATDWEEYAAQILQILSENKKLQNQHPGGGFSPRPESRPLTKFEQRGHRLGHGVWDLVFKRI